MSHLLKFDDRLGGWLYLHSDFELWTMGGFLIVAVLLASLAIDKRDRK